MNKAELYTEQHSSPEDSLLYKIYRETNLRHMNPRMVSGHIQGQFLQMISHMVQPERILEIGTFTGYSAICLAKGLSNKGVLHTIDIDDEVAEIALRYFVEAGIADSIKLHIGDALSVVPRLNEQFDLIFIDGEKRQYPKYYEMCMPYLKTGGFLLADNVLWNGKVLNPVPDKDLATKAIVLFNQMVQDDATVENLLLPIRDGLMVVRKK